MSRKTLAALSAAMMCALPASALAGGSGMAITVDGHNGTETRSVRVSLAGLDLASSQDARRAGSRIDRAAKEVCGWMNGSIQLPTREYRTCYGDALDGGRTGLNALMQGQRQG